MLQRGIKKGLVGSVIISTLYTQKGIYQHNNGCYQTHTYNVGTFGIYLYVKTENATQLPKIQLN